MSQSADPNHFRGTAGSSFYTAKTPIQLKGILNIYVYTVHIHTYIFMMSQTSCLNKYLVLK